MAEPKNKFAGLPGIAPLDEKDVYETDDLPEDDQDDLLVDEPESEYIDRPHLNTRTAHEKFRGKGLIPSRGMDFSDAARRRPHVGYLAISGEWEIAANSEFETLQQRRNRLEAEMRLLIDDLNKLKENGKDSKNDTQMAATLVPELQSSLRQLSQLQVPEDPGDITTNPDQHIQNIQKLIKELNEKEKLKAGKDGKANEAVITYQLNTFPANAQFVKSSRLVELELRLKKLESLLGLSPENLNRLRLADIKSIDEGVNDLTTRTNLLDLNNIDKIDNKLAKLLSKMDAVVEKRGGPQQVEIERKVNELYDSYKRVESLSQSLLPIADRLTALSALFQEAGEFKKTLSQLKVEMNYFTNKMAVDSAARDSIQEAMNELLDTVTANMVNFNTRLAAVKK